MGFMDIDKPSNLHLLFVLSFQWLETKVVGWLELIYGHQSPMLTEDSSSPIKSHKGRLYHFMYDIYSRIRIQQLFNIIIEFPESKPALLDLMTCLERTNLRGVLVQSLKHALETRLLHPGTRTFLFIWMYDRRPFEYRWFCSSYGTVSKFEGVHSSYCYPTISASL